MILKGSQRGGPRQLADHLLNDRDNDHVSVGELRGFVAQDLYGALAETLAVSRGTKCRQPVFSLSINPPKDAEVSREDLIAAADKSERALGLEDQPRSVIFHEKNGRLHAHVVWSRIDAEEMKAINLPHYKNRLREVSKELFLEHGWELPEGHKTNGHKSPLNFTLAEWQQAKRLDLDPREIKQIFQAAWARSDNLASFKAALDEHGYFLAKGDRRGIVALDISGNVFAVARFAGLRTKDLEAKLKGFEGLPGVDAVKAEARKALGKNLRKALEADRKEKQAALEPLQSAVTKLVGAHRQERERLSKAQEKRWQAETKARADKFRRGLGAVMDLLTGRWFALRKENETEAYAGYLRDRAQREALFAAQTRERRPLQDRIDRMRAQHSDDRRRTARQIMRVLRHSSPAKAKDREPDIERTKEREFRPKKGNP